MRLLISLAFAYYLGLSVDSKAGTILWTNVNGGSWSSAANWSPNQAPASTDTAVITNAGVYNVIVDAATTVAGLTLGGTSGSQTLLVNGQSLAVNGTHLINSNGFETLLS